MLSLIRFDLPVQLLLAAQDADLGGWGLNIQRVQRSNSYPACERSTAEADYANPLAAENCKVPALVHRHVIKERLSDLVDKVGPGIDGPTDIAEP